MTRIQEIEAREKAATAELLPCPFCGGEADDPDYRNLKFYVVCGGCYVRTDDFRCREDAHSAWNRRAKETAHA